MKIEGVIVGFDEYMNIVLDNAEEVYVKSGSRTRVGKIHDLTILSNVCTNIIYLTCSGKILLKGDCITLIQRANP